MRTAACPPAFLLAPLLLIAAPSAQDPDEPLLEGHSAHGEAFNEGPRQAAYLMPNPGNVHFPVTSPHPDVQAMFDQGVGQLHGFWYFEAERSFRQVAAWDPDCAMAYWGMAVANRENEERAAAFAQEAIDACARRVETTERERMFVNAWARFHGVDVDGDGDEDDQPAGAHGSGCGEGNGKGEGPGGGAGEGPRASAPAEDVDAEERDVKEAARRLILDLEEIIRAYPDDIEAKALLVVVTWGASYTGLEITSRQALQSVLDEVFAVQPNHPAHHYRIHLWDKEETSDYVVDTAVASGPSWPSVAHMWHMGGHIFENLGRHRDAAWQQDASARIDHAYMMRDMVLPDQIHNYAHNNEWLVRSLSHVGRVGEALDLARNMIELPRHPLWNMPDEGGTSSFWGRMRLTDTLQTFELWDELLELAGTNYLEPVDYDDDGDEETGDEAGDDAIEGAAQLAFALGEAHTYLGHPDERVARVDELRELLDAAKAERAAAVDAAEEEALACGGDDAAAKQAMESALDEHARGLEALRDRIAILEALAGVVDGEDVETQLGVLGEHGYRETALARLYAEAGRFGKAAELAREAVEERPGQAEAYATLAHVLWLAGEKEDALAAFDELRAISAELELDLPAFRRMAPLAEAAGLPADWRVALAIPDDVGARPDLSDLGPRRWTPPAAPAWSAEDALGATHTLADSSGAPRIVIFFLGFGCAHCVEQLQAFGPAAEDFGAAGIDIIAIGDDPPEKLADYQDAYPFPVYADPGYASFRAYRCYDDFEDVPLHGTFLIDGKDRIRWQDVSYEPFTDTAFLLGESKRLLGLPTL